MEETKEKTKKKRFEEGQLVILGALMPMLYFSIYKFGWKAAELMLLSAVLFYAAWFFADYIRGKLRLSKRNRYDLRGLAAGAIFFVTLSSESEWYVPVVAAIMFAVIVLMAGTETVFASVLFVRCLLAGSMANYFFTEGFLPAERMGYGLSVSCNGLLWGFAGGYIGEVCAVAILLGAVFLFVNKKGYPVISVSALAAGFLAFLILNSFDISSSFNQILTGNFLFVIGIAASEWMPGNLDDAETAVTLPSQIASGIMLAVLTAVFRTAGLTRTGAYLAFLICTGIRAVMISEKRRGRKHE